MNGFGKKQVDGYWDLVGRPWGEGWRCVDVVRMFFERMGEEPPVELTRSYGDSFELEKSSWIEVDGVSHVRPGDVVAQGDGEHDGLVTHVGVIVSAGWSGLTLTANESRGSFLMRNGALRDIVGIYRRPEGG